MYHKFKRTLKNVSGDETFKTNFGEIKNLKELRSLLFAKGKKLFNQYVNEEGNHFANWVEHVFGDNELAGSLRQTKSFHTTLKVLDSRIRYLELWIQQNKEKEELAKYVLKNKNMNLSFEPEFHKFETLSNHDSGWVNEFFPEKENSQEKKEDVFEKKLTKEMEMLEDLKEEYQLESKPGLFQRIFKRR